MDWQDIKILAKCCARDNHDQNHFFKPGAGNYFTFQFEGVNVNTCRKKLEYTTKPQSRMAY